MNHKITQLTGLLFLLIWGASCQQETNSGESTAGTDQAYERIVSLSGSVTETLFALGHGDKVVGIDVTSTYPADQPAEVSRLGHVRNLNVEGVLSTRPDLILVNKEDATRPAIQQLKDSDVEVLEIEQQNSLDNAVGIAEVLVDKLGGEAEFEAIKNRMEEQKSELDRLVGGSSVNKPKVLFIYARGTGNMMVAGRDTPAAAMIELAGGQNAVEEFDGFKALSAEGIIQAQPDVLLMFESGLQSVGGKAQLLSIPGVSETPAGKNENIIAMDGLYLLGFTPRAGSAALELAKALNQIDEQTAQNF